MTPEAFQQLQVLLQLNRRWIIKRLTFERHTGLGCLPPALLSPDIVAAVLLQRNFVLQAG